MFSSNSTTIKVAWEENLKLNCLCSEWAGPEHQLSSVSSSGISVLTLKSSLSKLLSFNKLSLSCVPPGVVIAFCSYTSMAPQYLLFTFSDLMILCPFLYIKFSLLIKLYIFSFLTGLWLMQKLIRFNLHVCWFSLCCVKIAKALATSCL